jgi:hypothetical protein
MLCGPIQSANGALMTAEVDTLRAAVLEELGPTEEWSTPGGYPGSLALCVIDSIQSIGQRYGGVRSVVDRYRGHRTKSGGDGDRDGAPELAATFEELGVEALAKGIGTGNRTYARLDAPLKAEVIRDAADLLCRHQVLSTDDLRGLDEQGIETLKRAWRSELRSQRSGISWRYLLMLAGAEGVKPDRMITRFLGRHVAGEAGLSQEAATDLVTAVARDLGVSANTLDHRIWLHEREREAGITDGAPSSVSNGKAMTNDEGQDPRWALACGFVRHQGLEPRTR